MTRRERLWALVTPDDVLVRFVPERRLAIAVAAVAIAWLLPGAAGVLAGTVAISLVMLAAAIDLALLPGRRGLSVTREAPPQVGIGDRVDGTYVVTSHWPRAMEVALFDRVSPAVQGGVRHAIVRLPPFGSVRVPFALVGMARRRAELGAIGARIRSRWGLVAARYAQALDDSILVVPSVSGVRRYRLLAIEQRLEAAGAHLLRRKGEGQSFAGLREYVLGDDPRLIDWKVTAKKHRLITREYTVERSQTVLTLIDAGRGMTQLAGTYSRFELALASALVLTDVAASAGDRVGSMVFDDEVRAFVPALQSRGALQHVRQAFIPLAASVREPDYGAAFRFLAMHQRKRALVVFYTDVIDLRASQALVAYVTRSAARHLAVVVALRNDAIFAAAAPRTAGTSALYYETAAAEELILAREGALETMRRAGVIVLDVSPQQMTAVVINRYLELKARGQL